MSKIIKLEQLQTFKNKCDTTYEKKLFPAGGIEVKDDTLASTYAVGFNPSTGAGLNSDSALFVAYNTSSKIYQIRTYKGTGYPMSSLTSYIDIPYTIGQILEVPNGWINNSYSQAYFTYTYGYFNDDGIFVPVLMPGRCKVNSTWETNTSIFINTTKTEDLVTYPAVKASTNTTKNITGMANSDTSKEFTQVCLEGSTYYCTAFNVTSTSSWTQYTGKAVTGVFSAADQKAEIAKITTCRITGYSKITNTGYWNRISKYTPTTSSHNLRNLSNTNVITSTYKDEMQQHMINVKPDYNTIIVNKDTKALEVDKTKMINKGKGIIIGDDNRISVDVTDRELHLYDVPPMKLMDVPSSAHGYTCENDLFTARSNCYLKFDEVIPFGEDSKTIHQLNCYRNGVAVPFEDMDSYVELPISSFYQTFRSPVGVLQEDNITTIGCIVYGQYNKFNQFVPFCFVGYHKSEDELEEAYQRSWCIASRITFTGGTDYKYVREGSSNLASRYMYLYNYLDELSEDLNPSDIVSGTFTCTDFVSATSGNNKWEFVGKNSDDETIVTVEQTQTEWGNLGIEFSYSTTDPHALGDSYNFTYNNFNSKNSFVNVMDIEFGGGSPSGTSGLNAIKDGAGFIQKQANGSYLWHPSSEEGIAGDQTPSSTIYRGKFANCVVRLYIKDADTVPVPVSTFAVYEIPNKVGDVDIKDYTGYCSKIANDHSIEKDIPLILESYLNNLYKPFHRTIAIAYDNQTIKINENDELYAVGGGGSSNVDDITMDGTSIVENKVAEFESLTGSEIDEMWE